MKKGKPVLLYIYTAMFFLYIFIPIILIFIFAWNKGEGYNFPLEGFTWHWFKELFEDRVAIDAINNSVVIAVSSSSISTFLGCLLAIGIFRGRAGKAFLFIVILLLPVLMPSLTIAISSLVFFKTIHIPLGIPTVIISHTSISMSYVFLIIMARIEEFPTELQEASVDLGAKWVMSLRDVVLPFLAPSLVAGWLFAFMISWNEFIVAYFLIGNNITLPVYIFSQLRFGISPKINVISVLITVFSFTIILLLLLSRKLYRKIYKKKI